MTQLAKCPYPQTIEGVLTLKLTGTTHSNPMYDAWVKGAGAGLATGQQDGHDHGYAEGYQRAASALRPIIKGLLELLNNDSDWCTPLESRIPDEGMALIKKAEELTQ